MLKGKKIVLGVTGSIAAFKSVFLLRLLQKEGAEVRVVMTSDATAFIKPISFSAFTKSPALHEFIGASGTWNDHVEIALWADLIIIAPATANTIAKIANGFCDNLPTAVVLSAKCPIAIAPAMDRDMWKFNAVQENIKKLRKNQIEILPPEKGELASGLEGEGRMAEPESIISWIENFFSPKNLVFKGKKVMITAGPTREPLDPVRFISNHSSGKMGYAIAEAFLNAGAEVHLVSGPVHLSPPEGKLKFYAVETADEMYETSMKLYPKMDVAVMSAAVSDFKPEKHSAKKIKKSDERMEISLKRNPDILEAIGKAKQKHQLNVGFALETDNELKNAQTKLKNKNADFIILNSLKDTGAGFGTDTNKITIVEKGNKFTNFELKSKKILAQDIVDFIGKKTINA